MTYELITVRTEADKVGIITLNRPKQLNALNEQLMTELGSALHAFDADPAIGCMILTGSEKAFAAGADIGGMASYSFANVYKDDFITRNWEKIRSVRKPVIAAVSGFALGGGCELAMMCDFIIAADNARFGQPEIKLGIIPGAGGTQRLPRALGVEPALNMIVSGEPVKSEMLAMVPGQQLFTKMASSAETLLAEALAYADEVADVRPLPQVRSLPCKHPLGDAYFQFARNMVGGMSKNFPAPLKCVDAVEAATKRKFDEGMAFERETFINLMWTPECRSLRHLFTAERAASKIPDVAADTAQRTINSVAIIGAGTMGGGIAMNFLNAGVPVKMLEMKQEALDRGLATIRKNYEAQVSKGKLKQDKYEQRMALLSTTLSYDDLIDADLVIEAVFEEIGVKEAVFKELDRVMKPGAILASNTSTLDLNKIASFTQRPQDVVGLHFFSPANVMKLLEVVRG